MAQISHFGMDYHFTFVEKPGVLQIIFFDSAKLGLGHPDHGRRKPEDLYLNERDLSTKKVLVMVCNVLIPRPLLLAAFIF